MINLDHKQLEQVRSILDAFIPNIPARAFGSRVKMTASEHSDLDIVIIDEQLIPQKLFYQLKDAFEESTLAIKVDVLDWHRISPEFKINIEKQYIKIYPLE